MAGARSVLEANNKRITKTRMSLMIDEFKQWYGKSKAIIKTPKAPKASKIQPEQAEQILAMDLLQIHAPEIYDICIHIANERRCSKWYGNILKRMGVKAGVSDLFFFEPRNSYHGLWIEVKTISGKPTKSQEEFIKKVISKGYSGMFAYGAQDVLDVVCAYFEIPIIKVPH
jgi:hypothetical protein